MNQNNKDKEQKDTKTRQIKLTIIGLAVLVIGLVGVTYAFFNYTRTGSSNVVKVGEISFNSEQSNTINITNIFPIDKEDIDTDTDNVGSVTIHVTGDTTYSNGIEYLVSAVDVNNIIGNGYNIKKMPISIDVSYSANGTGKTIGTENNNYFDIGERGGDTSYYKILSDETMRNGSELVVGYIAPNETGIDGNITIKAFIDKDKIVISDTYPETTKYILNPNMTPEIVTFCENYITSIGLNNYLSNGETLNDFCTGTGTLGGHDLESSANAGAFTTQDMNELLNGEVIIIDYSDNTSSDWVDGRVVFTTEEWNALQSSGVSFQIKVEANEGIWVNKPGTIDSCPNCKFTFLSSSVYYTTWNTRNVTPSVINRGLYDNYLDVVDGLDKKAFLGLEMNNNNQVIKAYACGVLNDTPFCLEGTPPEETTKYEEKQAFLQSSKLWNGPCQRTIERAGTSDEYEYFYCSPPNSLSTFAALHDHGCAETQFYSSNGLIGCIAEEIGRFSCGSN